MKYNNKGQINVVLKGQKKKIKVSKPNPAPEVAKPTTQEHPSLKKIEQEMESLIGMEEMKKMVKEIYAWLYINQRRQDHGLKQGKQVLHMMFKGNPGTGKTTMARLLGKLFFDMNVLSKGHLIEAERADLVGEYIGHTAQKTRDLVKKALGGILFIDEAYSLARGGEKDFGKEAIDTLVKHMEDKQNEFVLILAGYPQEMDNFLSLNPGLRSRFPIVIDFVDYTVDELMAIAGKLLSEREYEFSKDAELKIREHLHVQLAENKKSFSNGRYIRNVIEKSVRKQALRLLYDEEVDRKELITLRANDIDFDSL